MHKRIDNTVVPIVLKMQNKSQTSIVKVIYIINIIIAKNNFDK